VGGIGFFIDDGVQIHAHADAIGKDDDSYHLEEDDGHSLAAHALWKGHHFAFDAGLLFVGDINHINYIKRDYDMVMI